MIPKKRIICSNYCKGARIFYIETTEENVIQKFGLMYIYPWEWDSKLDTVRYYCLNRLHNSETLFCGCESEETCFEEIFSVLKIDNIKIKFKKKNDGINQDQLQREEASDSRFKEGSIIYGRRNIIKYSAGRHCDEAGIKNERKSSGRYKIIISSRCSEIYRS